MTIDLNEFLDALAERTARIVLAAVLPKLEAANQKVPLRWLTLKSAAAYIDKTYEGMRYTLKQHLKELPIILVGDKPYIDIRDLDRFMMNRKGK